MKLSLLIDSSIIEIDDFYNKIKETFKDINYELIFLDNGENESKLKDLYDKDLLHTRIIFYSGNIDDIVDKSIKYCNGQYLCFLNYDYELDLVVKAIDHLDKNKDCDFYKYVINVERNFRDKIKKLYPTSSFLIARNSIASFRCLVGYNGEEENLDITIEKKKVEYSKSFIGKMIGFNNDNLL